MLEDMGKHSRHAKETRRRLAVIREYLGYGDNIAGFVEELNKFHRVLYNRWHTYESPTNTSVPPIGMAMALLDMIPWLSLDYLYRGRRDTLPEGVARQIREIERRHEESHAA